LKNEIIERGTTLPDTIDDLHKFILIGREKLKAYQAKVNAIIKLNLSKSVRDQALSDSQDMATALLYAEAKMGELLKDQTSRGGSMDGKRGSKPSLPEGITHKQSHFAQRLYENKDLIEDTIKEAKENEDIPTRTEVLRKAREIQKQNIKTPELPKGVFDVIYSDPPWEYSNTGLTGMIEKQEHYHTLSIEKLCDMTIPIAKNAVMFLWVTNPMVEVAFQVIKAWGFEYKTNIVWVKRNLKKTGIGFYVRGQHELLFICVRGSFLPKSKEMIPSVLEADIREHSRKPDEAREIIEKLYPGCRYLELFARHQKERRGWTYWGNEA